ncbi:MAG: hypothetical protein NZL89_01860 [Leptospiraceae bacterium]|nr:hypothetical protein [Leptospiraceae bacterium]
MLNFALVLLFLGLGTLLCRKVAWLRRSQLPGSLVVGLIALAIFNSSNTARQSDFFFFLKSLPAEFIALVFACFFLQQPSGQRAQPRLEVLAETALLWVSVMGQVVLGLLATVLVIRPLWHFPLAFSSVLEAGFAGGHGTAVAIAPFLEQNGLAGALEYALASATVGLILGTAGGIWLIRLRHRQAAEPSPPEPVSAELQAVLLQLAFIAAAYATGIFYQHIAERELLPRLDARDFKLPLFAYTLLGGFTVRQVLHLLGLEAWLSPAVILLLADFFLEVLIFSGMAVVDVRLVAAGALPLLSLFTLGFLWNLFCHFYLRPKIFPLYYSFELGLINFGMLNGTSATGLMLLKMVDPAFRTPAVRVYAQSTAIIQPFIAGGILTLSTPFIVTVLPAYASLLLYGGLLLAWLVLGLYCGRKLAEFSQKHGGKRHR